MAYNPTTLRARLIFTEKRWIRAEDLANWISRAQLANTSVVTERAAVRNDLIGRLFTLARTERVPDDAEYIDSKKGDYSEGIQDALNFLLARGTDKGTSTDAQGNAVQTVKGMTSDSLRKWQKTLQAMSDHLLEGHGIVGRADVELVVPWTQPQQGGGGNQPPNGGSGAGRGGSLG